MVKRLGRLGCCLGALGLLVAALLARPGLAGAARPPYPPSRLIRRVTWGATRSAARGSDNFSLTWADDGNLYTAYGDGWGFDPRVPRKLSLGLAKVIGPPEQFKGVNIRSPSAEHKGDGPSGKKCSGMLMVGGVLYMWVRNANGRGRQVQLAWSRDHARTWTWSPWKIPELGFCCFLNFGRNYQGARDGYVYSYSPNTPHAYNETDDVVLMRVPKDRLADRAAYEFFSGLDAAGAPTWSAEIGRRRSVFHFPRGCNRQDVVYNAPLKRYLMTQRGRAQAGGVNHFSIYDAPEPWGPWTTVYYESQKGKRVRGWGEHQHFPSKWISSDGKTLFMVHVGGDRFNVVEATFTLAEDASWNGYEAREHAAASGEILPYRLLRPRDYDPQKKYPLVLYMHGRSAIGNDNVRQLRIVEGKAALFTRPEVREEYPCFVVAPQCPPGMLWVNTRYEALAHTQSDEPSEALRMVMKLLERIQQEFSIDPDRLYTVGQSMGGFAAWDMITRWPDRFAAAVPLVGGGDETQAARVVHVPIWAFCGELDRKVPPSRTRNMIAAVREAGGNPRLTVYPDEGHRCYLKAYGDPALLRWLFDQKRPARTAAATAPTASKPQPAPPPTPPKPVVSPPVRRPSSLQVRRTAPVPVARSVSADRIAEWDAKLLARIGQGLKAKRALRCFLPSIRVRVEIIAVDDDEGTLRARLRKEEITLAWSSLSLLDRSRLARSVLRQEDDAAGHCLVAFYLLCTGGEEAAREHLRRAGEEAAVVQAAFK